VERGRRGRVNAIFPFPWQWGGVRGGVEILNPDVEIFAPCPPLELSEGEAADSSVHVEKTGNTNPKTLYFPVLP
jgi:hypothetical protein